MLRRVFIFQNGNGETIEGYIKLTTDSIVTLNNTIANCADNSIIYLEEGPHVVDKSILVGRSNVSLVGVSNKTVLQNNAILGSTGVVRFIGTSDNPITNIVFEGFVVDGNMTASKTSHGLELQYTGIGFTNTNNTYNSNINGSGYQNKVGVRIEDCIIKNNANNGIYLNSSSNNTVTANTVQNNTNYGIYLQSSSNNNAITANTVQNNANNGIYLYSSSNNTVTANTVQNNNSYGIYLNASSNNTITANTVQNNTNVGIYLYSSSNNTITANTVQNNNGRGIYLYSSSNNNTVTANTVQNNSNVGIYSNSSSNNIIGSNEVLNNFATGIYLYSTANNYNNILSNISLGNTTSNLTIDGGTGNINNVNTIA